MIGALGENVKSKFGFCKSINVRQNGKMSKPNLLD